MVAEEGNVWGDTSSATMLEAGAEPWFIAGRHGSVLAQAGDAGRPTRGLLL
jgi:hypothetical protein